MNDIGADSVISAMEYITDICGATYGSCDNCPLFVKDNDVECAYYLAKIALDANWSDYHNTKSGMIPDAYYMDRS